MTCSEEGMFNCKILNEDIKVGDGNVIKATKMGSKHVNVLLRPGGVTQEFAITECKYVSKLWTNSVSHPLFQMTESSCLLQSRLKPSQKHNLWCHSRSHHATHYIPQLEHSDNIPIVQEDVQENQQVPTADESVPVDVPMEPPPCHDCSCYSSGHQRSP
jgi:hypothetical protein